MNYSDLTELTQRARKHIADYGHNIASNSKWRKVRVGIFHLSVNKDDRLQIYAHGENCLESPSSNEVRNHRELVGELLPKLRKIQVLDDLASI